MRWVNLSLPTRKQAIKLLKEHVPENVLRHSLQVNKISVLLANKLKKSGLDIDVELVDRASLLHDLDKIKTLRKPNHGEVTEKILSDMGYLELGKTAKKHRCNFIKDLITWEEKIVHYADRRVLHDQIVSVDERFRDARERYPNLDFNQEIVEMTKQLEQEIFKRIDINPEDIR